jgi:hypothetical protein
MIRDWRKINKDNVNDPVVGYFGRLGRTWIINESSDTDEEGMRHVMSLKPYMGNPDIEIMPMSLLCKPRCLEIYVEYGGPFKDFFVSGPWNYTHHISVEACFRYLFEQGANPPDPNLFIVPLWLKKVYQEVERRRENCRAACIILCAMRQWPRQRCVFLNRSQRDVLGIVIQNVWKKRTSEEWEI